MLSDVIFGATQGSIFGALLLYLYVYMICLTWYERFMSLFVRIIIPYFEGLNNELAIAKLEQDGETV